MNVLAIKMRACGALLAVLLLLLASSDVVLAQVRKTFTQRTSQYSPNRKIYNIKGDFTMIGNSNMTIAGSNPNNNSTNSNTNMVYIDVDGVDTTFNSSTAALTLSNENGAVEDCSNIIYAGLYWTGRAHNGGSSAQTFPVTKNIPGSQVVSTTANIGHNSTLSAGGFSTGYTMSITREGSSNAYFPRYTLSGSGLPTIILEVRNGSSGPYAYVSYNNGTSFTPLPGQSSETAGSNSSSRREVTIDPAYVLHNQTGANAFTLKLNRIRRDLRTNQNQDGYRDQYNDIRIEIERTVNGQVAFTKTLDKRKVYIKGPTGAYQTVTASANNIHYPSNADENMYGAYAEVTDFVRQNGLGNYTVADVALREGDGGSAGFYGGWSMIVVYENSKMNWRDVTIFDGYAFIKALLTGIDESYELPVTGFHAAQEGPVNVKMGMIAGEGDRSISGDFFKIRNAANTAWVSLNHGPNTTNNFFNSSINTGGGARNPNYANNTGLDILMFNLDNTDNELIANNASATKFQFGTNQDLYSILAIAFAVDAYVPEVDQMNTVASVNGQAPVSGNISIAPGQQVGMDLQIKNSGTEEVHSGRIIIPVPFMAEFVSASATYNLSPNNGVQPYFDATEGPTGSIIWDIGTIPLPEVDAEGQIINDLFATLHYSFSATTDCAVLKNTNCETSFSINGSLSGVGATSQTAFDNRPFIQGFDTNQNCLGEPITAAVDIDIDSTAYVAANCANTPNEQSFTVCNPVNDEVPVSLVSGAFPPGSRFYAAFPVNANTTEYTAANPFPVTTGDNTFFAVPPGDNGCFFEFNIIVTNIDAPLADADQYFCQIQQPTTS